MSTDLGQLERIGWWLGIAAVVLMFVGFFGIDDGGSLGPDTPVRQLAREITDGHTRTIVGSMVGMIGALLLVGVVASLRMHSQAGADIAPDAGDLDERATAAARP